VKLPHVRQIEEPVAVQAHDRRCARNGLLQSENGAEQRQQKQAAERYNSDATPGATPGVRAIRCGPTTFHCREFAMTHLKRALRTAHAPIFFLFVFLARGEFKPA
jgi:hypothetical protein